MAGYCSNFTMKSKNRQGSAAGPMTGSVRRIPDQKKRCIPVPMCRQPQAKQPSWPFPRHRIQISRGFRRRLDRQALGIPAKDIFPGSGQKRQDPPLTADQFQIQIADPAGINYDEKNDLKRLLEVQIVVHRTGVEPVPKASETFVLSTGLTVHMVSGSRRTIL